MLLGSKRWHRARRRRLRLAFKRNGALQYIQLTLKLDICLAPARRGPTSTREAYIAAVQSWYGWKAPWVRRDARLNWHLFEEHSEDLRAWVAHYDRDPGFQIGDKWHNSSGTLTGMAWLASKQITALLDFEENFQTFFLRRGLIEYLKLLLGELRGEVFE